MRAALHSMRNGSRRMAATVTTTTATANPPNTHPAPVCLLSVCPPFLVELCHRKHKKLVLAVSFNRCVQNDVGLLSAEIESDPSAALHYPESYANGDVAFDDVSGESLEVDKV